MPKTLEGKARSSQNSFKHGMFSRKALILGDESAQDFEVVRRGWMTTYQPQGYMGERLVQQLIFNDWMLRRANRRLAEVLAGEMDDGYQHRVELMQRYKTTAERAFFRALAVLEQMRREARREQARELARRPLENRNSGAKNEVPARWKHPRIET